MTVEAVSQRDYARRKEHAAVTTCIQAWPAALIDAHAVGYPTTSDGPTGRGGISDPTARIAEALVEQPDPATAWLAELYDVIAAFLDPYMPRLQPGWWVIYTTTTISSLWHSAVDEHVNRFPADQHQAKQLDRLANAARVNWPPPPKKGQTIDGVTIGARTNTADMPCANCGLPVDDIHDPGKRLGRQDLLHLAAGPGHGACYQQVWRSRGGHKQVGVA